MTTLPPAGPFPADPSAAGSSVAGFSAAGSARQRGVEALLVTGTVGAGKTSVAEALGDLLAEHRVPHAVIDLDWLRRCWPSPPGDPFHLAITLRNLRAIAATFLDAGAQRLVLAGVVESRSERDQHQAAVGVPLAVCRLRVDLPLVQQRLTRRHDQDPTGRVWHLARCGELDGILDRAEVEDFAIDVGTATITEVAEALRVAARW